jgi:LysR family transcriptional regulator, low CO2-responsive transcriptional regulator
MSRPSAITLKQLRALSAIHERGSVTLAAETLQLTVPAVSTQLKLLAQNIGTKLVVRNSDRRTELTLQGLQVLATINKIDTALERCFQSIDAINSGKSGLVTLGVVSTGKYYAPSILALAKQELPDVQINLIIGNRQQIVAALEDHSMDLVIMGRPPRHPEVDSILLGDHPHVLIAPPDHRLAGKRDILPHDILSETIILRERGSGTRILMERFLDRVGEGDTYDSIEFNSNETIKQAAIAGLGIALISAHTVSDALAEGRIVTLDLPGLPIIRRWFLVRAVDAPQTPVSRRVRDFLAENADAFLPAYRAD